MTDNNNNGVQGVTVTFKVLTGTGTVSNGTVTGDSVTVPTNANGIATITSWILGGAAGTNNNSLSATATGTGITGNPITFTASATGGVNPQYKFLVRTPAGEDQIVSCEKCGYAANRYFAPIEARRN